MRSYVSNGSARAGGTVAAARFTTGTQGAGEIRFYRGLRGVPLMGVSAGVPGDTHAASDNTSFSEGK
jgi:hypothetical protein